MMVDISKITTEKRNENTKNIDMSTTCDILKMINNEDKTVALAVEKAIDQIADVVNVVTDSFRNGGRLFYIGAGTSGRLGVLDASECPPTFGVSPQMVIGIIAGGDHALRSNAARMVLDDAVRAEWSAHQLGRRSGQVDGYRRMTHGCRKLFDGSNCLPHKPVSPSPGRTALGF